MKEEYMPETSIKNYAEDLEKRIESEMRECSRLISKINDALNTMKNRDRTSGKKFSGASRETAQRK